MVDTLSEVELLELLELLFLPGFSTGDKVTEMSGRGAVLAVVRKFGGNIRTETRKGAGTTFLIQFSVLRALLMEIGGRRRPKECRGGSVRPPYGCNIVDEDLDRPAS